MEKLLGGIAFWVIVPSLIWPDTVGKFFLSLVLWLIGAAAALALSWAFVVLAFYVALWLIRQGWQYAARLMREYRAHRKAQTLKPAFERKEFTTGTSYAETPRPAPDDPHAERRRKLQALIDGATDKGTKENARAALKKLDQSHD